MKKDLLLLILPVILFAGCRKQTTEQQQLGPLYSIPDNIQQWTIYNQGSYWIYLNEKTQETDSVSVKHGPYYHKDLCYNCPVREYRWYYLRSSFLFKIDIHGGPDGNATAYIVPNISSIVPALTEKSLDDPAHADTTIGYYYAYSVVERLDSLILNGNTIHDVLHTRLTYKQDCYSDCVKTWDYYWVKNLGLVKITKTYANRDSTWSLVRFHPVQ